MYPFAETDLCSSGTLGVLFALLFIGYAVKKAKESAVANAKALGSFVSHNPYAREVGTGVLHKVLNGLFR
jgi:hypothetical protein